MLIRGTTFLDMDMEELLHLTNSGDSIFYNKSSFLCSKLSCGGAIETCRAVWTGAVKNAIAVIRPPGHHAEPHSPMGFCLLNNVAVAAKVMQRDYPECKKILILDWYEYMQLSSPIPLPPRPPSSSFLFNQKENNIFLSLKLSLKRKGKRRV